MESKFGKVSRSLEYIFCLWLYVVIHESRLDRIDTTHQKRPLPMNDTDRLKNISQSFKIKNWSEIIDLTDHI